MKFRLKIESIRIYINPDVKPIVFENIDITQDMEEDEYLSYCKRLVDIFTDRFSHEGE